MTPPDGIDRARARHQAVQMNWWSALPQKSLPPAQIWVHRPGFGIDVDENRFGVKMSEWVSTVVLRRNRGYRLPNGLQTSRTRKAAQRLGSLTNVMRAPKGARSLSGAGDARYSAVVVADQPAREADLNRRKVVKVRDLPDGRGHGARQMFADILSLIARSRAPPDPA